MGQMKECEIIEMTSANQGDYELRDYVFTVIGRIVPGLQNDEWSHREELFEQTYESHYPEHEKLDEYINSEDSIAFLYYCKGKCIGHIRLSSNDEIKYASIDRLIVLEDSRGNGIGTALLDRAKEWAVSKEMKGLTLDTQDINLHACRFYMKAGFEIGAVDTMLYSNSRYKGEKAIYFYLKF